MYYIWKKHKLQKLCLIFNLKCVCTAIYALHVFEEKKRQNNFFFHGDVKFKL